MSGLRFASFGAATVTTSKIIADTNLDVRPYQIVAKSVNAPYIPTILSKETIPWPDDEPETIEHDSGIFTCGSGSTISWTNSSLQVKHVKIWLWNNDGGHTLSSPGLMVDGAKVQDIPNIPPAGGEWTSNGFWVKPNGELSATIYGGLNYFRYIVTNTGKVGGPYTFDLTDKWLALDSNMYGVTTTISILGTDVPYADYPLYFPISPTSITFGTEFPPEHRPNVEVYK